MRAPYRCCNLRLDISKKAVHLSLRNKEDVGRIFAGFKDTDGLFPTDSVLIEKKNIGAELGGAILLINVLDHHYVAQIHTCPPRILLLFYIMVILFVILREVPYKWDRKTVGHRKATRSLRYRGHPRYPGTKLLHHC